MTDQYLVQTHSQTTVTGISLLEVHSTRKTLVTIMPIGEKTPDTSETGR